MILQVSNGTTVILQRTIVIYGDVNGDGFINSNDARIIRNVTLGTQTLAGPFRLAGNVNHDLAGLINTLDYVVISKYLNGTGTIVQ
jgi:hypothetical protein